MREKLAVDRDSEISATSLRVSLLCPVSEGGLGWGRKGRGREERWEGGAERKGEGERR